MSSTSGGSIAIQLADQVFRYLRSLTGDAEVARDLTQDLLLGLHGRGEAGPALVFTAARNRGLSWLRRQTARRRHEVEAADESALHALPAPAGDRPDRLLEAADLRRDLRAALACLSEEQRTVFHLTEIEGLRYADVAAVLGISAGTVASRKHHAVQRLQAELRRRGHDT